MVATIEHPERASLADVRSLSRRAQGEGVRSMAYAALLEVAYAARSEAVRRAAWRGLEGVK